MLLNWKKSYDCVYNSFPALLHTLCLPSLDNGHFQASLYPLFFLLPLSLSHSRAHTFLAPRSLFYKEIFIQNPVTQVTYFRNIINIFYGGGHPELRTASWCRASCWAHTTMDWPTTGFLQRVCGALWAPWGQCGPRTLTDSGLGALHQWQV